MEVILSRIVISTLIFCTDSLSRNSQFSGMIEGKTSTAILLQMAFMGSGLKCVAPDRKKTQLKMGHSYVNNNY